MSIWSYNNNVRDTKAISDATKLEHCVYCKTPLETLQNYSREINGGSSGDVVFFRTCCCQVCGWWTKVQEALQAYGDERGGYPAIDIYGAVGSLRELDLKDQSIPIEEIRAYLAAKYDARFDIDPWRFEETIASVYKDLGYETRVTARSGDDGVDVILDGPDNSVIGVQVKRYKGKISVEQIRSLAGALLLNGMTRGIFITTSSFQSGAHSTTERLRLRGMPIELVDAKRFYEALGLAQRSMYKSIPDPTTPFFDATLIQIGVKFL